MKTFYVSLEGNDQWSGKLPDPNRTRTDGPFATLERARNAIRRLKAVGKLLEPVTVKIRGGTYYLSETITFTAEDSGTKKCPITYEAYPDEKPILSGGRKITGWRKYRGKILQAHLPEVRSGKWYFRSLFANGERQTRARYPNDDPRVPYRNRFLYVAETGNEYRRLIVAELVNVGDWLAYKTNIPATGQYTFWISYSANNKRFGFTDLNGRLNIRADNQDPVPLADLPDTTGKKPWRWGRAATLLLNKGQHTLTLRNEQGGLIDIEAFVLSANSRWIPADGTLPESAPRRQRVVIKASDFTKSHGNEIVIAPRPGKAYSKTSFPFRPGDVKRSWAREPDAEIHIFPSIDSCRGYNLITWLKQVDEKKHKVKISGRECINKLATGDRYFVENVFEELDSPGEWYLNRKTGTLYFWPKKKLSSATEVIAPRLGRIFQFEGTETNPIRYIRLVGLTFRETDYSPYDGNVGWAVGNVSTAHFQYASYCAIERCRFENIGKAAVFIYQGSNNTVMSNDIAFSAEGSIIIAYSPGNKVSDNHIHHCGEVYKHIIGIVMYGHRAGGNIISHNLIHDMPNKGISMGNAGRRNIVEYNEIYNVDLETYDTGAIEVTQNDDPKFRSGSIIRYNLIHDSVGYSTDMGIDLFCSWGIYLDSYAGGYTVNHNITYRNSYGGIMFQGGKDNRVFNNMFIDAGFYPLTLVNWNNNSTGLDIRRNIVYCRKKGAGRAIRAVFSAGSISRKILHCNHNIYYCPDNTAVSSFCFWHGRRRHGIWSDVSFADWQKAGFDRKSTIVDPLFVNPGKDDYQLKPGSPAFRLGFKPIDIQRIGLLRKRCQCHSRPALPAFNQCSRQCAPCKERYRGGTPCSHLKDVFHK